MPESIYLGPTLIKVNFKSGRSYNIRNLATCLGKTPSTEQKYKADYIVGWATGTGGNLLLSEKKY